MSKPVFYYMIESPACRTVLAVARILDIDLELRRLNLLAKEQLAPEFVRLNPFHVIPTLVDTDGFVVWESRTICSYLIQRYRPDSSLYPQDLKHRTNVDKLLQYDLGTLFRALSDITYEEMQGRDPAPKIERAHEILETFEEYLVAIGIGPAAGSGWVADTKELSLADISIHFTLDYYRIVPGLDLSQYPNVRGLNERIGAALKPYQVDGDFDKAIESIKKLIEQMKAQTQK